MEQSNKDKVIEAYRAAYDAIPQEALDLDLRVTVQTVQELAEGQPVSAERLAEVWEMPVEQVRAILKQGEARGSAQLDSAGNLIGGVLSLVPTHHRVRVNDNDLYAWCAYDAIYVPGVLGKTAQVESSDPVSGETIRLTVTPEGVTDYHPERTVVSVVGAEASQSGGPDSARCSQMLFFASRESAEKWLKNHPGVTILTVEEAFEIARTFQIEPARRMGLVG